MGGSTGSATAGGPADRLFDAVTEGLGRRFEVPAFESCCIIGDASATALCMVARDLADHCFPRPVQSVTDGRVPGWVGPGTLCIIVPDSGDVADLVRGRGAEAVVLGTGCDDSGGHALGSILAVLISAGLVDMEGVADAVSTARDASRRFREDAGRVADAISDRVPAFYSTSSMSAAAVWWARSVSEATGRPAFHGELPEFDHNELVGWSDPNAHAPDLEAVVLRGRCESRMVEVIVGGMLEVLCENGRRVTVVDVPGDDPLTADLCALGMGAEVACALEVGQ